MLLSKIISVANTKKYIMNGRQFSKDKSNATSWPRKMLIADNLFINRRPPSPLSLSDLSSRSPLISFDKLLFYLLFTRARELESSWAEMELNSNKNYHTQPTSSHCILPPSPGLDLQINLTWSWREENNILFLVDR